MQMAVLTRVFTTVTAHLVRHTVHHTPFCSVAPGIMRRIAVRAVALRLLSGRLRLRILGGAVRYGDSKEMVLTPCTEIARTPAESLTLAECQNTKRRVFPVGSV